MSVDELAWRTGAAARDVVDRWRLAFNLQPAPPVRRRSVAAAAPRWSPIPLGAWQMHWLAVEMTAPHTAWSVTSVLLVLSAFTLASGFIAPLKDLYGSVESAPDALSGRVTLTISR